MAQAERISREGEIDIRDIRPTITEAEKMAGNRIGRLMSLLGIESISNAREDMRTKMKDLFTYLLELLENTTNDFDIQLLSQYRSQIANCIRLL